MTKQKVCIRAVEKYNQHDIDVAMRCMIDELGGIDRFVRKGQIIVLKPNLVIAAEPRKATTTHPMVVGAVAKLCAEAGASKVIVMDSPGGPFNPTYVNGVYKKTGMTAMVEDVREWARENAPNCTVSLNDDFSETQVAYPDGVMAKKIPICTALYDADVIINIAKMKTHAFAGFSAACKNMYGAIPGLVKVEWHQYFQDLNSFSDCMLDIQGYFADKLNLHIVDAIEAMEGPGPTAGTPIHMGLLLASKCFTSVDIACVKLMDDDIYNMPTITRAAERGFVNKDLSIDIQGTSIAEFVNKKYKRMAPSTFSATGKSKVTQWLMRRMFSQKPVVSKRKCIGCMKCSEHCPVDCIHSRDKGRGKRKGKYVTFDLDKCIRCFCCQELCPLHIVKVKTPIVVKIMNRSKRRRARKSQKRRASTNACPGMNNRQ